MEGNMQEYLTEKKAREKRLAVYTEKIQETVLNTSAETIRLLVEERHNQKMTQQELSDITGIQPSNLARFESGGRVPTLVVLEKYANALGKHIEIKICDNPIHRQRISVIAGKRKDRFRNRISESDYVSEYRCKSDILYRKED